MGGFLSLFGTLCLDGLLLFIDPLKRAGFLAFFGTLQMFGFLVSFD